MPRSSAWRAKALRGGAMAPMRLRVPLARRLAVMVDMSGSGPIARVRTGGLLAAVVAILAVIAVVLAGCGAPRKPRLQIRRGDPRREPGRCGARRARCTSRVSTTPPRPRKSKAKGKPETKLVPASTIELQLTGDGGRARLVVSGSESETIRVGSTLYVKGGPALYRSLARRTGVHVARGRWLKAPVNGSRLREFALLHRTGRGARPAAAKPHALAHQGHHHHDQRAESDRTERRRASSTPARSTSPRPASPTRSRSSNTAERPARPPSPAGTSQSRSTRPPARSN